MITIVCAGVMALFSLGGGANARANEVATVRSAAAAAAMTSAERRTYRLTLAALIAVWLGVVLTFSPWGLARPRDVRNGEHVDRPARTDRY